MVRDARETAAASVTRVRLTGPNGRAWLVRDAPTIQRVLAKLPGGTRSTIAFECITRDETLPHLAALVTAPSRYLHIAGNGATLRAWPDRDEASVDEVTLGLGSAFARIRAACTTTWINGYVADPGAAAVAALARALAVVDQPEIDFDLDLPVDVAAELVAAYPAAALEVSA